VQIDGAGKEQLRVSRLAMDVVGAGTDLSADPRFAKAVADKIWYSPVYFRKESEPYMTISIAHVGRNAGVTVAEVNLKFIWDVVTSIKVGEAGYAYVVNGEGRLIAHPDISLVLRDTDLSRLPQVADGLAALKQHATQSSLVTTATGPTGTSVLTAFAAIPHLDWLVFVELPSREALAPVYASLTQTGALLGVGLLLAAIAGAMLARRMTIPIHRLQSGAERLGAGELDHRIDIRTGDEIEALASRFNRMAGQLQESYETLESRVEERTRDLAEALEQQTATSEVLRIVASSPDDLQPVFDAMLEKATELCAAKFGALLLYDGETYRAVATKNLPPAVATLFGDAHRPEPNTATARVLETKQPIAIEDLRQDIAYIERRPLRVALVDKGGARAQLVVPLLKKGEVIGAFLIYLPEPRPFADSQVALVTTFADQAVIAIENARLINETREALDRQTATAEVLKVISRSPGDLQPVFATMLENATRICQAEFGRLALYDGETFTNVTVRGATPEYTKFLEEHPNRRGSGGSLDRMASELKTVHLLDIAAGPGYQSRNPFSVAAVELGGARSMIAVPLLKEQTLIGGLVLFRKRVEAFTEKQIELVTTFADQAVIAIENSRLLGELRTRNADLAESLDRQTATSEVLRAISRSPTDTQPVFDAIAASAQRLCEGDFGVVIRYDGELAHLMALHGGTPDEFAPLQAAFPSKPVGLAAEALEQRTVVHAPDITADPRSRLKQTVVSAGGRAFVFVPMLREGAAIGLILVMRRQPRAFTDTQIELLKTFADQAVIAIENARLLGELRERSAELARSVDELTATADVLRIVASSPDDLQPVFDAMLEKATELCAAKFGYLLLYDGNAYRTVAFRNVPPALIAAFVGRPLQPGPNTGLGRLIRTRQTEYIEDIRNDVGYFERDPVRVTLVEIGGARAQLVVPLLKKGELIGAFLIYREEPGPFAANHTALVTTFADQAVIAIENARLLGELRDRSAELARSVDELTTLREVGQAVSSTLDLGTVLETIVARAVGLAGAEAGAIYRYRKSDRQFRLGTSFGLDEALAAKIRQAPIQESETAALARAINERAPVQIPDLEAVPHLPLRDLMVAAGFRAVLMVPLIAVDRVFGVLSIQKKTAGEFPESTIKLMQTFASQSVLAIQNARLFREVEEQGRALALASQHKSQFLANMSHELRTPLNAILGYAELLVDGIYGELSEKARGVLERVQSNGKHLLGLINDVLDLSKIEAGQLTLAVDDYAMPAVVHSVVSATESLAKAKGLALETSVPKDLPLGSGDERRLTQVVLNLVGNAIKFTDKGSVAIAVTCANRRFDLAVSDTGPGIAEADQARIFEEFQQVDNSNTRRKGGTGLGLSISKKIVELHGGTITVESELGKGSTFHVVIPVRVTQEREVA